MSCAFVRATKALIVPDTAIAIRDPNRAERFLVNAHSPSVSYGQFVRWTAGCDIWCPARPWNHDLFDKLLIRVENASDWKTLHNR